MIMSQEAALLKAKEGFQKIEESILGTLGKAGQTLIGFDQKSLQTK